MTVKSKRGRRRYLVFTVPGSASPRDQVARERLQAVFPERTVELIDCRALLSGHGSLHCITMQYPEGWIR